MSNISGLLEQLPKSNKTGWPWDNETSPNAYNMSFDWPKISIVTPSYNQGQYIEETIRSVLLQNYPNLEYIIIDGGSTDETVDIIKKYDRWITYWISKEDKGQTHAINKGIEKCRGDVFNWLNSDDLLAPKSLYHIGISINENRDNDVYCFNINYLEGNELTWLNPPTHYNTKSVQKTLEYGTVNQPGMYYNRIAVERIGRLNEILHFVMDYDLWFRYLLKSNKPQVFCDSGKYPVAYFRIHEESKTSKKEHDFLTDFQKEIVSLCIGNDQIKSRLKKALEHPHHDLGYSKIIHSSHHSFKFSNFINSLLLNFAIANFYKFNMRGALKLLLYINPIYLSFSKCRDWFYLLRKSLL